MKTLRYVLFWVVVIVLAALAMLFLLDDPGSLSFDFRGMTYTTSMVTALAVGAGVLLALWVIWKLLAAPFVALRKRRERQQRLHLTHGLDALEQGHWSRAEKSLLQAAGRRDDACVARAGAARAAAARDDQVAVAQHLDVLATDHATTRALVSAEMALAQDRADDALAALDAPNAQPLPPRGLALRAQALAASGRTHDAYGLLGPMRKQHALPDRRLDALEAKWSATALREAADPNALADRWEALRKPLRSEPSVVAAYAERAAQLRWEEASASSLEDALASHWDDDLASLYGRLQIGRLDARREHAEGWLKSHPSSPGLLLTLARLNRAQGNWSQAETYLHRALAQGANSEAWEELGHGFAQNGDDARARLSYANALRAARDEPITELPDREMRERIFDEAVDEDRDEQGMPRLRE